MRKLLYIITIAALWWPSAAAARQHHYHHGGQYAHNQRRLPIVHHRAHKADVEADEPSWAEWQQECLAEGLEPEWCIQARRAGEAEEAN